MRLFTPYFRPPRDQDYQKSEVKEQQIGGTQMKFIIEMENAEFNIFLAQAEITCNVHAEPRPDIR